MNVNPEIIYREMTTSDEISQVLRLQKKYHKDQLSPSDRNKNGYVTVIHTQELLEKMQSILPQIIAVNKGRIVGYALSMSPEMSEWIPVLQPMVKIFENVNIYEKPLNSSKYYVMGQICIDEGFRGFGVFRALYNQHKQFFGNEYDYCVTEVAVRNLKSMAAHESIGFKTIHTYTDETDDWNVMLWDWK